MKRNVMQKMFSKELKKDKAYKINGQYVITGKGDSWNDAKDEIEKLYNSWIESCELLGQGEDEIISRINGSEIVKETENDMINYYFIDKKGIIGEPLIIKADNEEQQLNLYLLLLLISSKLESNIKEQIRAFVKQEQMK